MADIAPAFIRTLITDVIVAREHLSKTDDQVHRRGVIRTRFAAMEGLVWLLRNDVLKVGTDMGHLTPLDALALRDQGYAVNDKGVLRSIPQFMSLTTAVRYSIRQVQAINPEISVSYEGMGWSSLVDALKVRHRITHPKTAGDLTITTENLDSTLVAFTWLLAVVEEAMQATHAAFRTFNDDARILLAALKRGDPAALQLYNEQLARDDS